MPDTLTRNEKIVAWAKANPCSTLQEIGDYYGITWQRVQQIIARAGEHKKSAPSARKKMATCDVCGHETPESHRLAKQRLRPYRCWPCKSANRFIAVSCLECGLSVQRERNNVIRSANDPQYKGRTFCGHSCAAIYRQKHEPFGFTKKVARQTR